MKSMIPMEPLLVFPVILNGYPASIARYHRKGKKKKKPAAILMPCKSLRNGLQWYWVYCAYPWLHLRDPLNKAQPNGERAGTTLEILRHCTHGDGEDRMCSIMATFYFLTWSQPSQVMADSPSMVVNWRHIFNGGHTSTSLDVQNYRLQNLNHLACRFGKFIV